MNHDTLWGPSSSSSEDKHYLSNSSKEPTTHPSINVFAKLRKTGEPIYNKKPTIFITGKPVRPSNSSGKSNTVKTTPKSFTQFEVVTSKSTTVDGEEIDDLEEAVAATMLYHRYGSGSNPADPNQIFGSGYVSTDSSIAFDDEQNNVGGEVGVEAETTLVPKFYQGNGIRRRDMTSTLNGRLVDEDEEVTTTQSSVNKEASQSHSPSTMKQYTFQRGKSSLSSSWAKAKREKSTDSSPIIADTNSSSEKIMGLGPRLKLRLRTYN